MARRVLSWSLRSRRKPNLLISSGAIGLKFSLAGDPLPHLDQNRVQKHQTLEPLDKNVQWAAKLSEEVLMHYYSKF